MTMRFWTQTLVVKVTFMMLLVCVNKPAFSQVDGTWPEYNAKFYGYTTIFQCQAALDRMFLSSRERTQLNDSLAFDTSNVLRRIPDRIVSAARLCRDRINSDSVNPKLFDIWMNYFVWAELYTDADMLADGRLSQFINPRGGSGGSAFKADARDSTQIEDQQYVLSSLVRAYLMQGGNLKKSLGYLDMLLNVQDIPWQRKYRAAVNFFNVARMKGDRPVARRGYERLRGLFESIDSIDYDSREYGDLKLALMMGAHYVYHRELVDSLKVSTDRYVSFHTKLNRGWTWWGKKAPPLKGDFWFPDMPSMLPPVAGKVTVIVGEDMNSIGFGSADLWEAAGMVRRLKTAYPEIEVYYATQTQGALVSQNQWGARTGVIPPSPQLEAELYRQRLIRDFYGFPATVVVEDTKFWKLADPDRRRINEKTDNSTNYGNFIWLIDQDGRIVFNAIINRDEEEKFTDYIGALLSRS